MDQLICKKCKLLIGFNSSSHRVKVFHENGSSEWKLSINPVQVKTTFTLLPHQIQIFRFLHCCYIKSFAFYIVTISILLHLHCDYVTGFTYTLLPNHYSLHFKCCHIMIVNFYIVATSWLGQVSLYFMKKIKVLKMFRL